MTELDLKNEKKAGLKMDVDDFKKLKIARHKLENIIQKNDFDLEIENQLKEVQRLLNSIHSNHSYFEEKS